MLLAIEIGFVHGEGVDELLDLAVGIAAQEGEIGREERDLEERHAIADAPLHVIALGCREQHAGAPVEEIADLLEILVGNSLRFAHGPPMRSVASLILKAMKGSSTNRSAQRRSVGKACSRPISANTSTAAAQTFFSVSRSSRSHNSRLASLSGKPRASSQLSRRTSASGSASRSATWPRAASGMARSASRAPVRRLASSDLRYGSSAAALSRLPMRLSPVKIASRTTGSLSPDSAPASRGTASRLSAAARTAAQRCSLVPSPKLDGMATG